MSDELYRRLRELGVVRGVRDMAEPSRRRCVAIEALVPGRFHSTSRGQCFVVEQRYALDTCHGDLSLAALLDLPQKRVAEVFAEVGEDPSLSDVDFRRACFLDTETTGLSGGSGTMAFVVGLGYFEAHDAESPVFHLQQFFLRDPGDEPAMIEALADLLPRFDLLVSFNGRAFDVPILENRFILARARPPTVGIPHLDLLLLARRLWRYSLESCRLGALEQEVLGVLREQDDVPSGVIPYLYRDYLLTGDARDMKRVIYHNGIDVLSLVVLAARLSRAFTDPWNGGALSAGELYGLGRYYASRGRMAESERAYRAALHQPLAASLHIRVMAELGSMLKRAERREEAFGWWQQLAIVASPGTPEHVLACVELAKYFEWHLEDARLAAEWTKLALRAVRTQPSSVESRIALEELRHRLERLERKLAHLGSEDTAEQ